MDDDDHYNEEGFSCTMASGFVCISICSSQMIEGFIVIENGGQERREIPITKFGLAVAISLGGALYTYHRIKQSKPHYPKSKTPPDDESQADARIENNHALQNLSFRTISSQNSITGHSSNGDKESILLPEPSDLDKESNMSISTDGICPIKNGSEYPFLDIDHKCNEYEEQERVILRLRNEVKFLQEKERNLELQLLEYYGMQEQETAVMELQNQLKLNTMEAKLYNLKIESLLLDNRRLEAQVSDYANAATELGAARAHIKMLKKKLKFEVERNREQLLKLQDRVMNLQEQEKKAAEIDQEREMLKAKLEEMRNCNEVLQQENSDLVQQLDYIKMLAPSALDKEVLQLREEKQHLEQKNEDSRKKIERLQDDRCRDLEELVYLRWINACLRYELRIYRPDGGKSIARDLSKNLSPKTAVEAKKLILEHTNADSGNIESDQWSSSPASCLTGERDESLLDPTASNKATNSGKNLFAKLRRLLRGKRITGSASQTPVRIPPPLERTKSADTIPGRLSCEFPSETEDVKASRSLSRTSSRRSFDLPGSYSKQSIAGGSSGNCSRRTNDDDLSSMITRMESLPGYGGNWSSQPDEDAQIAAKDDLVKFAEALKNCAPKSRKSSISYESS